MPFNINTFAQNGLTYGGARPSLFDITLAPPAAIGFTGDLQKLTLTCTAAQLPGYTLGTVEAPYFGRKIKLAGDRTFDDWTITVMNDEDYMIRDMFESWNSAINSLNGNLKLIANNGYKVNSLINHYSKSGAIIKAYEMIGLWPALVSPMDADWDQTNRIQTYQVTLAYDEFAPINYASGVNVSV